MRTFVPLAVLPLALVSCAGPAPQPPAGSPAFTQALASEYQQFSQSELMQADWDDQSVFRDKAKVAQQGRVPTPEDPTKRSVGTGVQLHPSVDIGKEQRAEAIQGRQRLMTALQGGGMDRNPQAAARAQVAYDCWVEQLEEGWQRDDIERCRQAFNVAMTQLEARPVAQVPAEKLQIYFDFDSAQITPAGKQVVALAAEDIRKEGAASVSVVGHADRAGSDAYNQQLSAARAEAVRDVLVAQGIPADRVRIVPRGETDPQVPTPDNVRQPQNRRAAIDYD